MRKFSPDNKAEILKRLIIHNEISRKKLVKGDRLPSVREMARTYGAKPSTLGKVVNGLIRERILVSRPKSGLFVDRLKESGRYLNRQGMVLLLLPSMSRDGLDILNEMDKVFSQKNISVAAHTVDWHTKALPDYIHSNVRTGFLSGMILYHPTSTDNPGDRAYFESLKRKGMPIALIDTCWKGFFNVSTDYQEAAGLAVDYLAGLGHRNILFIGMEEGPSAVIESRMIPRLEQLQRRKSGVRIAIIRTAMDADAMGGIIERLPSELERTGSSAVFASNDFLAHFVVEGLVRKGISVPGRISVMGFGNSLAENVIGLPERSSLCSPEGRITTVGFGFRQKGKLAAEHLAACLAGFGPAGKKEFVIPAHIIEGQTCRRIP